MLTNIFAVATTGRYCTLSSWTATSGAQLNRGCNIYKFKEKQRKKEQSDDVCAL